MAKPIDLYQGAAPRNMEQMGAGLSQAGANIGQTIGQGYAALGQGLAKAGEAYAGYESAKAGNDMIKTILKDKKMSEQFFGISDDQQRRDMFSSFNKIISQHGQYGAAKASMPLLQSFMQDAQMGREYANKVRLAQETAKAQFQYSPKAVRYSSFVDNESLYPQGTQQSDPVTGGMDLNATSQPGADQSLPLLGGTGIAQQFDQAFTSRPLHLGQNPSQ